MGFFVGINSVEIMSFKFLIFEPLTCRFFFPVPSSVAERDVSNLHAWLYALVGFLCFVMLVPRQLVAQNYFNRESIAMIRSAR